MLSCKLTCAALVVLSLGFGFQGSGAPGEFSPADRTAIEKADAVWQEAANAHDFAKLAKVYTEDAVLLPPNSPVIEGRRAIQAFFAAFPPFEGMRLKQIECVGRGDLAYARGEYAMKILPPGGEPIDEKGKYLEIWRKGADGGWQLARDMFSSDLPAEGAQ